MKKRYNNQKPRLRYPNREYENRINEIRLEEDLTYKEIGDQVGKNYNCISELAAGMISPMALNGKHKGRLKPWVVNVCEVLKSDPAYVFPREICDIKRGNLVPEQIIDVVHGYNGNGKSEKLIYLYSLFKNLNKQQKKVILLRFFEEKTLDEIGVKLGVTKERVRQIEGRALRIMRRFGKSLDIN